MLGLFLAACYPGGDGSEAPGSPTIPLVEGMTVAELETTVPADFFILRGTIPVPPGVFDPEDGVQPFGIVDATGETYGAQAEVATWYADDANDGADVVEIIARVSRGGIPIGSKASYRVVLASHPAQPDPGAADVGDLVAGPLVIPTVVDALLGNPGSVELRSRDCFDNLYLTYPLNGAGSMKLTRYGEHQAELRVYQHLAAAPPVSGATPTLDHWLGAHAYVSTWNSEELVGFDLRVTNADSGNDPLPFDDPLGRVYFKDFEVVVPNGWAVVQDYDDPFVGTPYNEGGKTVFPIVEPLAGGKLHTIAWGGQFHRRLALCRVGSEPAAREKLRGAGLAFAKPGLSDAGNPLWSWWNPLTARYFPQSHLLPSLAHVLPATLQSNLVNERNMLQGHLESGTSGGGYPVDAPVLGWAHPYGTAYGGMTGGAEIHIFEGMKTAYAREVAGYQKFRMLHRMHSDRMPNALYNLDGEPTSVEDWLSSGPAGLYVPFEHFIVPNTSGSDAFGLYLADQTHVDHVTSSGLKPDYESELSSFDPHDYQHFIRYTRSAKVLSWLANDTLAQDDLLMQAENFKLSYHPYNNGAYGGEQGTGMASDITYVAEHPASGFPIGRGEGWGLDCSTAAYSAADRGWRAERREWFDAYAELVFDGQGGCNGFLQANVAPKMIDGKYRARQAIEHVILDNAIRGLVERVYRGFDVAYTAMLEDVLRDSYYALISDMSWGPGESKPWQYTAVGPLDLGQPVWCSLGGMPADGYTPGAYDNFQNWSDLGYARELTGDGKFLDKASLMEGGTSDLLGSLENDGLNNLENKAGLLALLQFENGDL